jgi:hypothetical protein
MNMSALTQKQKIRVEEAFARGVKDIVIAQRLGLATKAVAEHRKNCGLTRELVTGWRHAMWKEMLYAGHTLEHIAILYGVRPNSVKLMLWHDERFSLREAKKKAAKGHMAMQMTRTGKPADFAW